MALKAGYYGVKKGLLNKLQKLTGIYSLDSETLELSSAGELKVIGGSGGTTVEGNPQDEATDTLSKIKIGTTVYDVPDTTYSEGTGVDISAQNVISLDAGIDDLNDVVITSPQDGQILQYDAANQKWVNHINVPEYISITLDIYSAASDTVTYTDETGQKTVTTDTDGHGRAIIVCVNGDSITFTSSVAKNPSDLSANYSKTVNITSSTTAVYVMPDNTIFWYGYESSNFAIANASNGWISSGYSYENPTKQTYYYLCNSTQATKLSYITNKNSVNASVFHVLARKDSGYDSASFLLITRTKNAVESGRIEYKLTDITYSVAHYTLQNTLTNPVYLLYGAEGIRAGDGYALWYE